MRHIITSEGNNSNINPKGSFAIEILEYLPYPRVNSSQKETAIFHGSVSELEGFIAKLTNIKENASASFKAHNTHTPGKSQSETDAGEKEERQEYRVFRFLEDNYRHGLNIFPKGSIVSEDILNISSVPDDLLKGRVIEEIIIEEIIKVAK